MLRADLPSPVPPRASALGQTSEAAWLALDEALRRLIVRLCVAARGQSAQLDAQLGKVSATTRKRAELPEIESLMGDLGRAIAALDDQPAGVSRLPVAASGAEPDPLASAARMIAGLLEKLAIEPAAQTRVAEIKAQILAATADGAALAEAVDRMAELVNQQLRQFQRDKGEIERTLQQVNEQLDEVASYLFGEDADRSSAQQSGTQLQGEVLGELAGIDASVQRANDLAALRDEVSQRTRAIHSHVEAFRDREAARLVAYQERADRMRSRIGELERETHALQDSLHREKRLAATDALTGIPNRLAWDERLVQEHTRWKRFRRPTCIAAWDIDHFKSINDTFGHSAGDKVLYVVAQHLARGVREVDFVARYGGEEFAMLLVGTTGEGALKICDSLRERIAKLNFHFRQKPITVTLSCGITALEGDDTVEAAFERADMAMYDAKRGGRNTCRLG